MKRLWIVILILMCGCSQLTRTIYVPEGDAVRLRETVNAKVWVKTQSGDIVAGEMPLSEGWFCMSLSDEELRDLELEDLDDPQADKPKPFLGIIP